MRTVVLRKVEKVRLVGAICEPAPVYRFPRGGQFANLPKNATLTATNHRSALAAMSLR
jgi:hypothetical protein